jgi:collagen type I alpha
VLSGAKAIDLAVYSTGVVLVSQGGTAIDTMLSAGGTESIFIGGSVQGTAIEGGGGEYVSKGGESNAATIGSGGRQYVELAGSASATAVASGGYQFVSGGVAYSTTIANGGYQFVSGGGSAGTVTVAGGGMQYVGSDGFSDDVLLEDGGFQIVSGGLTSGTTIESAGIQFLSNGGVAVSATVDAGGTQEVGLYGAASTTSIQNGGVELLYSGGMIDGTTLESGGTIDLTTFAYETDAAPTLNSTTDILTIRNSSSSTELQLSGNYSSASFSLSPDPFGGTDVILDGPPCYCRGTRILTENGYVAVEHLVLGQNVLSPWGEASPIRWLGHRHVTLQQCLHPWNAEPIRIEAHAFGSGLPQRPLFLSPDHAVFRGGVLIPIRYLINGATVAQMNVGEVEYWHLELDEHRAVLAEGLPAETYLDTGNRTNFSRTSCKSRHEPEHSLRIWKQKSFAPLRLSGPEVDAARTHLLGRLPQLGYQLISSPRLRMSVDGRQIRPKRFGGWSEVRLSRPAKVLRLLSLSGIPSQTEADGIDHRRLGVAVTAVLIDGINLSLDDRRFASGWHIAEPNLRWTTGEAFLDIGGARSIALHINEKLPQYLIAKGSPPASTAEG